LTRIADRGYEKEEEGLRTTGSLPRSTKEVTWGGEDGEDDQRSG